MKSLKVDLKTVRGNLACVIRDLGMTPNAFAKKVDIDPSNFAKKLKGDLPINRNDFLKFQEANINVDFLTTGEGAMYTDGNNSTLVPVYEEEFGCGFLAFNDPALHHIGLADMPGTKGATCWCKATGHSMEPKIDNGDYVCLKRLEGWDDFLVFGDIYAVDAVNDMRTIKRIERGATEDEYTLVPENGDFEAQPIKKNLIRGLFRVLAVTKIL